ARHDVRSAVGLEELAGRRLPRRRDSSGPLVAHVPDVAVDAFLRGSPLRRDDGSLLVGYDEPDRVAARLLLLLGLFDFGLDEIVDRDAAGRVRRPEAARRETAPIPGLEHRRRRRGEEV